MSGSGSGSGDEELPIWAPSLERIAAEIPAYTRGEFLGEGEESGAEQLTFTADTDPSAATVAELRLNGIDEILGRVGITIPERCYRLARITCALYVAVAVSREKIPDDSDEARGEHRSLVARYLDNLDKLDKLVHRPLALRLNDPEDREESAGSGS